MRVVVIGSSNTDLVISTPRLPTPGETLLAGEFQQFAGGKGANQAVAAARAGAQVTLIGAHGDDAFGRAARAGLRREGVDVRYFRTKAGLPSGIAMILLGGKERQNMIAVAKSANDALAPADVRAAERTIAKANVLLAQFEVPISAVSTAAELAHRHGVHFILNPAPARPIPKAMWTQIHTLIVNEVEAAQLAGQTSAGSVNGSEDHARILLAKGCGAVVVTLGAAGALVVEGARATRLRAPKAKPVDTVGAGDCFCGWFATSIANGTSRIAAAQIAVKAAALAVTRRGAQAGMPYAHELRS
jgi:ribokinase